MDAVVTGGAGFIGSHLCEALIERGYKVLSLDDLSTGRIENLMNLMGFGSFSFMRFDLRNPSGLPEIIRGAEVVFHFAALPTVNIPEFMYGEQFERNTSAVFNLLEAMRKAGVGALIFASSSAVYGNPERNPVVETDPVRPISLYGATKAAAESLISAYAHLHLRKAVILRYANVVGPRMTRGVIPDLLRKLRSGGGILEVLGDGSQRRSFIYVTDAVNAAVETWERISGGLEVYNVGNLDSMSIREVAETVIQTSGIRDVRLSFRPGPGGVGWPSDVKEIVLNIGKIREEVGWFPTLGSRDSIVRTVDLLL